MDSTTAGLLAAEICLPSKIESFILARIYVTDANGIVIGDDRIIGHIGIDIDIGDTDNLNTVLMRLLNRQFVFFHVQ